MKGASSQLFMFMGGIFNNLENLVILQSSFSVEAFYSQPNNGGNSSLSFEFATTEIRESLLANLSLA